MAEDVEVSGVDMLVGEVGQPLRTGPVPLAVDAGHASAVERGSSPATVPLAEDARVCHGEARENGGRHEQPQGRDCWRADDGPEDDDNSNDRNEPGVGKAVVLDAEAGDQRLSLRQPR